MKKLVVSTVFLSLAFLLSSMLCAFGLATIFVPGRVGFIFDGVGAYSASVFFYEKQYEKTNDVNDLYVVVKKVDVEEDSVRAERLLDEIINHDDFRKLCETVDAENSQSSITTRDYCYSSYCFALIENDKVDMAQTYSNEISSTYVKTAVVSEIQQRKITN